MQATVKRADIIDRNRDCTRDRVRGSSIPYNDTLKSWNGCEGPRNRRRKGTESLEDALGCTFSREVDICWLPTVSRHSKGLLRANLPKDSLKDAEEVGARAAHGAAAVAGALLEKRLGAEETDHEAGIIEPASEHHPPCSRYIARGIG